MEKKYIGLTLALAVSLFFRLFNILYFHSLESDEALYAQVVFALTKGYTPYRDIFVGHPPLYFYMAVPFYTALPGLYSIRLYNVVLSVTTLILIFILCYRVYNEREAIVASLIYAVYPFAIYSSKLVLVDNAVSLFIILSVLFLAEYIHKNDLRWAVVSGIFAGMSTITKFTGIYASIAIFLFIALRLRRTKPIALFAAGFVIIPLAVISLILYTGIWEFFYAQTIDWQFIRFSLYTTEKLWFGIQGIGILSPLIVPAIVMVVKVKGSDKVYDELMLILFLLPLAIILLFKVVFLQYFIMLLIPLCIMAARSIDHYFPANFSVLNNPLLINLRHSYKKVILATVLGVVMFSFWTQMTLTYGGDWFMMTGCLYSADQNILLQRQIEAGNYISNLAGQDDKIWSSNAAFGFFSQRIIVTPDSRDWKFQGFFPDVWGYQWTVDDYRGQIVGHPTGLFSLADIKEAWEEQTPKLIVIDRTNRTSSSVVDYFIWNGINNPDHSEKGLSHYIESKYHLISDEEGFELTSVGIEIWIRNP